MAPPPPPPAPRPLAPIERAAVEAAWGATVSRWRLIIGGTTGVFTGFAAAVVSLEPLPFALVGGLLMAPVVALGWWWSLRVGPESAHTELVLPPGARLGSLRGRLDHWSPAGSESSDVYRIGATGVQLPRHWTCPEGEVYALAVTPTTTAAAEQRWASAPPLPYVVEMVYVGAPKASAAGRLSLQTDVRAGRISTASVRFRSTVPIWT